MISQQTCEAFKLGCQWYGNVLFQFGIGQFFWSRYHRIKQCQGVHVMQTSRARSPPGRAGVKKRRRRKTVDMKTERWFSFISFAGSRSSVSFARIVLVSVCWGVRLRDEPKERPPTLIRFVDGLLRDDSTLRFRKKNLELN